MISPSLLRMTVGCALIALLSVSFASQTQAQVVDPQIYICTGCNAAPGGDPNVVNASSINVGFDGNHTGVSPLLILVAVPNATSSSDPTISLPTGVSPIAAGTYYGAATNGGLTGDQATLALTSTSGGTVLSQALGISDSGGSLNWTNLSGFDDSHGLTVSNTNGFTIYVFGIDYALNSGTGGNSPITIGFSNIGEGSFVAAYNCGTAGATCSGGDVGQTVFTNAGVIEGGSVTPEPASMLLFGTGLVALGAKLRKRKSQARLAV